MKKTKPVGVVHFILCSTIAIGCAVDDSIDNIDVSKSKSSSSSTSYDFTAGCPSGATCSNVQFGTSGVTIGTSGGSYYDDADGYDSYVDIPVSASDISGKLIQLKATRINSLPSPSIDSGTTACSTTSKLSGWYAAPASGTCISATDDGTGNYVMELEDTMSQGLEQSFRVEPGETYNISFDFNGDSLLYDDDAKEYGYLNSYLRYQKSSGSNLKVYHPYDFNDTAYSDSDLKVWAIQKYNQGHGNGRKSFLLKTTDCQNMTFDTHTVNNCSYTDADGTTTDCSCTSGDANKIEYASVTFKTSSSTSSGYSATVDNVIVNRQDQIEVAILDSASNVLQQSYIENGFYVDPTATTSAASIRIYLRSHKGTESPNVESMTLSDGMGITIDIDSSTTKTFSKARMGVNGFGAPPRSELYDSSVTKSRSTCANADGTSSANCIQYVKNNNAKWFRFNLTPQLPEGATINAIWNGSSYTFELSSYGQFYFQKRVDDMKRGGYTPLAVIAPTPYVYECTSSTSCNASTSSIDDLSHIADMAASSGSSETTVIRGMVSDIAEYFVEFLDGTNTYTRGTKTVSYSKVQYFEVFNEVNLTSSSCGSGEVSLWSNCMSRDDYLDFQNEVSTNIESARSSITKVTSGLAGTHIFDTWYLNYALSSGYWDSSSVDALNFHPYVNDLAFLPEDTWSRWDAVQDVLSSYSWTSGLPIHFTEYAYYTSTYSASCNYRGSDGKLTSDATQSDYFQRGWGEDEFAKLTARSTLIHLSLPVDSVMYYGAETHETESGGGDVDNPASLYSCWEADWEYTHNIYDRVSSSGILAGKTTPTRFRANDAGTAWNTISNYLSLSSPYDATEISVDDTDYQSEEDHYYATSYEVSDGFIVAMWWYRDYVYGGWMDYMNDITGIKDNGFEEKRIHSISLNIDRSDAADFANATLISLDGSATQTLSMTNTSGAISTSGVTFGELPVLIKFTK